MRAAAPQRRCGKLPHYPGELLLRSVAKAREAEHFIVAPRDSPHHAEKGLPVTDTKDHQQPFLPFEFTPVPATLKRNNRRRRPAQPTELSRLPPPPPQPQPRPRPRDPHWLDSKPVKLIALIAALLTIVSFALGTCSLGSGLLSPHDDSAQDLTDPRKWPPEVRR